MSKWASQPASWAEASPLEAVGASGPTAMPVALPSVRSSHERRRAPMRAGPASSRGLPTVRGARLREGLVQRGRPLASRGGEFEHGLVENQPWYSLSLSSPARSSPRAEVQIGIPNGQHSLCDPLGCPGRGAGIPGQIRIVDPVETEPLGRLGLLFRRGRETSTRAVKSSAMRGLARRPAVGPRGSLPASSWRPRSRE